MRVRSQYNVHPKYFFRVALLLCGKVCSVLRVWHLSGESKGSLVEILMWVESYIYVSLHVALMKTCHLNPVELSKIFYALHRKWHTRIGTLSEIPFSWYFLVIKIWCCKIMQIIWVYFFFGWLLSKFLFHCSVSSDMLALLDFLV